MVLQLKLQSCDTTVLSPELEKHGHIFLIFLILVVKHTDSISRFIATCLKNITFNEFTQTTVLPPNYVASKCFCLKVLK